MLYLRRLAAISGNFPSGRVRLVPKKAPPCPTQPVTSDHPKGLTYFGCTENNQLEEVKI